MSKQPVRQRAVIDSIASARREAGLSQRELSEQLGEAINFMQRIESGERNVSVVEFISIARAIGMDPCDMLRRALR
jgi:transcriptional regulator with XRE-family HTH domain